MTTGTFHLQAISNFGMARYLPQPGTIHVIDPSLVTIATSTSQVTMVHNYSGPVPVITALATPITNAKVLWFIVEPGFTGPGLINLIPDFTSNRCEVSYGGDAGLDRLPGKLFHIRIQSVEVPTVWADIPVAVQ
ncbi:MAG: hypothetical protein IPL96_02415 [Holophagaceae bacterium]|nr:hypothetical protein [Holophagaceae bacterium]